MEGYHEELSMTDVFYDTLAVVREILSLTASSLSLALYAKFLSQFATACGNYLLDRVALEVRHAGSPLECPIDAA